MQRTIESLNGLSFILPEGYTVVEEKNIFNGEKTFLHKENYISKEMKVISFFEIHKNPEEFFNSYLAETENYNAETDMSELKQHFNFQVADKSFPAFVIKNLKPNLMYILQVFIDCGDDCLGCFSINMDRWNDDINALANDNKLLGDLVKILGTI